MSHGFVAYIDEAGDDGLGQFRAPGQGGQTHWLVLGACIVAASNDVELPSWRDAIREAFPNKTRRDIHFRDLNHDQRVFACRSIATRPLGAVVVLSNKLTLPNHPKYRFYKSEKNLLYKYLLRYLLEKTTEIRRRRHSKSPCGDGKVRLVFSRRGGMDYKDFLKYMLRLRTLQTTDGSLHLVFWEHLDLEKVEAVDHATRAGLQLADVIASAFFQGVEPNPYGGFEPRYAQELRPIVVRSTQGKFLNFGVKPVPKLADMPLGPEQQQFFAWWSEKGGQTPGP